MTVHLHGVLQLDLCFEIESAYMHEAERQVVTVLKRIRRDLLLTRARKGGASVEVPTDVVVNAVHVGIAKLAEGEGKAVVAQQKQHSPTVH